jgi:hypothetical protein
VILHDISVAGLFAAVESYYFAQVNGLHCSPSCMMRAANNISSAIFWFLGTAFSAEF